MHGQLVAVVTISCVIRPPFTLKSSDKVLFTVDIEGVGSENTSISRCNFNESLVEDMPPPEEKKQEVEFLRFLPAI